MYLKNDVTVSQLDECSLNIQKY